MTIRGNPLPLLKARIAMVFLKIKYVVLVVLPYENKARLLFPESAIYLLKKKKKKPTKV